MPNIKVKYIMDENGDRVAPVTHIDAVRDSNGNGLSDLMVPENLGFGIGTCSTSSGTALTVALQGYKLVKNGYVTITFENDVPASSTLNINSQGAKAIYYKGAAIESGVIKADDTITFSYDGTNYEVISLGGGGSAAGLEIVAASGTTLNAEVGKYYRFDSDVTTLTVNLPAVTDVTEVQMIKLYFNITTSPNIFFTSSEDVIYSDDFNITKALQECTIIYNGSGWVLSNKEIISNNFLLKLGKTLTDESGYNWTTTTSGTVTPNYNNEGILLGGSSSLDLDTGIKDIILNKDFSISLDVKLVSAYKRNSCLISMSGSNSEGGAAYFILENSVISSVMYYADEIKIKQNFSGSLNTWYNFEFRKQGGRSSILINGVTVGASDYTNTNNAGNFAIGANQHAPSESINGIVRNVKIKLL